ncbi:FadR/GntR family transcriptional regulator [Amycolatopsis azurea]|nr:FCD domain-containing protein [Amycolatopsis azurea]
MSGAVMEKVARGSLVDQAIDRIRGAISSGQWAVGERIPAEAGLIEALGVARNTMREAVKALAYAGILEVRHGDGTYVRATDETEAAIMRRLELADLHDVLIVRRGLEVEAARQAAERRRPADLRRLSELSREVADDEEADEVVARAMEFHKAVVELSHNPVLIEFYGAFSSAVAAGMRRMAIDGALPHFDVGAHNELHVAIVEGDPDRAGGEAARHIDHVLEGVREQLGHDR